jgi:hypothetical protein
LVQGLISEIPSWVLGCISIILTGTTVYLARCRCAGYQLVPSGDESQTRDLESGIFSNETELTSITLTADSTVEQPETGAVGPVVTPGNSGARPKHSIFNPRFFGFGTKKPDKSQEPKAVKTDTNPKPDGKPDDKPDGKPDGKTVPSVIYNKQQQQVVFANSTFSPQIDHDIPVDIWNESEINPFDVQPHLHTHPRRSPLPHTNPFSAFNSNETPSVEQPFFELKSFDRTIFPQPTATLQLRPGPIPQHHVTPRPRPGSIVGRNPAVMVDTDIDNVTHEELSPISATRPKRKRVNHNKASTPTSLHTPATRPSTCRHGSQRKSTPSTKPNNNTTGAGPIPIDLTPDLDGAGRRTNRPTVKKRTPRPRTANRIRKYQK